MPSDDLQDRLRALPGVDRVVARPEVEALLADHPRWAVVDAVRAALEDVRQALLAGRPAPADLDDHLARETAHRTDELLRPGLFPVVNATGVVLHTNLGRAPMAPEALAAMAAVQRGYSNLEYDLAEGRRGSRHGHLAGLIRSLTGAEAALVTNNNASAVMLALAALAGGGEVIVSRGELIEIGESFRIPDVCTQGGVTLVEVGTTNRTHDTDYARSVTARA